MECHLNDIMKIKNNLNEIKLTSCLKPYNLT